MVNRLARANHKEHNVITHGTMELPEGSLTVKRTTIGGVIATRDKGIVPNAAVITGCCSISRWYVLEKRSVARKLSRY
jgi:hypothetical protein